MSVAATAEVFATALARYEELQELVAALDEDIEAIRAGRSLRGDGLGILRPCDRFIGWSDEDLIEVAERMGRDPFQADWWCDLDPDVVGDYAPGRFGKSRSYHVGKDTQKIDRLERERASLEEETAAALREVEALYEATTAGRACPGSGTAVGRTLWGELPHDGCYRLCRYCERLQRVEAGRLVEHTAKAAKSDAA